MRFLAFCSLFARRVYAGLFLYIYPRCVSIIVWVNPVNLKDPVSKRIRQLCRNKSCLGVLGVNKWFCKMEKDEMDVRHEAIRGHGYRINLGKCQTEFANDTYY
jgi:hypothetical protein